MDNEDNQSQPPQTPAMWGCFQQAKMTAAAFAVVPAFLEDHANPAAQAVSIVLSIFVAIGCLVAIFKLDQALAKRFVYDRSEPHKIRSERARNAMGCVSLLLCILWAVLCWGFGHGIVLIANNWFARS